MLRQTLIILTLLIGLPVSTEAGVDFCRRTVRLQQLFIGHTGLSKIPFLGTPLRYFKLYILLKRVTPEAVLNRRISSVNLKEAQALADYLINPELLQSLPQLESFGTERLRTSYRTHAANAIDLLALYEKTSSEKTFSSTAVLLIKNLPAQTSPDAVAFFIRKLVTSLPRETALSFFTALKQSAIRKTAIHLKDASLFWDHLLTLAAVHPTAADPESLDSVEWLVRNTLHSLQSRNLKEPIPIYLQRLQTARSLAASAAHFYDVMGDEARAFAFTRLSAEIFERERSESLLFIGDEGD